MDSNLKSTESETLCLMPAICGLPGPLNGFHTHWFGTNIKEIGGKDFVLYTSYELIPGEVLAMTEDRLSIIFTLCEMIKNQESRDLI